VTVRPLLLGLAAIGLNLLGCGTTPPTPAEAAVAPSSGKLSYSNAWRIEVSEGANSDGEILFRVTPKDGATQDVRVVIDDGTSEDLEAPEAKAFSVQYHPEASPGPHDSRYLFDDFVKMMDEFRTSTT